jgi:hypothetical protein
MALRVLSGIIKPSSGFRHRGNAVIDFADHSVNGNVDAVGSQWMEQIGPNAPFNEEPCKMLALRWITFSDQDHSRPSEAVNVDRKSFDIDSWLDPTMGNRLNVRWETDGIGSEIREISYMIVGDAG